ncbi:hypothetical protein Tco_0085844 [Tanacetum coccineum]
MGDTTARTRFESVSKHSNDSLLARGNTLRSDEDRLKLDELMALCTTLQNRVLDLEKTKTTQHNEIASLKRRVKKLEKKNRSRTHKLKRLYKVGLTARVESSRDEESLGEDASKQGRINAIDADEEITLVSVQDDADKEMFDVDALNGEEVFVAGQNENVVEEVVDVAQVSTAATTVTITTEEITLAQALEALKTSKPKVKGIVFQEPGKSTTTTIISSQESQDKDKGILIVLGIIFELIRQNMNETRWKQKNQSRWKRISGKRTKNQAKTDKTEHRMEKRGKTKVKKSTKSKLTPKKINISNPRRYKELLSKLLQICKNKIEECWRNLSPSSYDDDDDEESSIPLKDIIMSELPPCVAITPALYTDEPVDYLIMEDEHLDTIPKTESDKFIKSSVENLVQNPSESEDECECDVPDCDDSQTTNFSMFSNPLFDNSTSSDDESSHEEVIHEMSFKTYSNPLFDLDKEIISSEFNLIHNEDLDSTPKDVRFDVESYILESLGDILFLESLLYDNSSPRPPKAFQDNSNTIIESPPTFLIPVEDSDSLREDIDIFPGSDDSIPPGIENDDFDTEDDDNSTSLPEFESFHVDYPDSGDSTIDVVEDIPVDVPNILPTHPAFHMDFDFIPSINDLGSDLNDSSPSGDRNKIYYPRICNEVKSTRFLATLSPVIDTLIPFSSKNDAKVFNHGVLASKKKSPPSSSHRGFKALQLSSKSPMLIHGDNTPNFGVRHLHFYPP